MESGNDEPKPPRGGRAKDGNPAPDDGKPHTEKGRIKEMKQDKERAYDGFIAMVRNSWTWGRLTVEERDRFTSAMKTRLCDIKGSYLQRRAAYSACYGMFLEGLGYEPIGWREPEPKYEWVVSYDDGEEAFITKEKVENPRF